MKDRRINANEGQSGLIRDQLLEICQAPTGPDREALVQRLAKDPALHLIADLLESAFQRVSDHDCQP